jgi:hypothetical protein
MRGHNRINMFTSVSIGKIFETSRNHLSQNVQIKLQGDLMQNQVVTAQLLSSAVLALKYV